MKGMLSVLWAVSIVLMVVMTPPVNPLKQITMITRTPTDYGPVIPPGGYFMSSRTPTDTPTPTPTSTLTFTPPPIETLSLPTTPPALTPVVLYTPTVTPSFSERFISGLADNSSTILIAFIGLMGVMTTAFFSYLASKNKKA